MKAGGAAENIAIATNHPRGVARDEEGAAGVVVILGAVEGRLAEGVADVGISAGVEEELQDGTGPGGGGEVNRTVAGVVSDRRIRSGPKQSPYNRRGTACGRMVQQSPSRRFGISGVRAPATQPLLDDPEAPVVSGGLADV